MTSVEDFLRNKPAQQIALFTRFVEFVRSCGEVTLAPARTRVGFQARMIFAAINRLSGGGLEVHVVLRRRLPHARFTRVDAINATCYVHHFRIASENEIDDDVQAWLTEAYDVGTQREVLEHRARQRRRSEDAPDPKTASN